MVAIRQDFLRLLREDAEFKAEVRRAVLTDEVLNMPETLARISSRMDEMSVWMGEMSVRQDEMSAGISHMGGRLRSVEIDVAELKGDMVELKMANRIVPFISDKLELRAGLIVRGGQPTAASVEFDDLFYDVRKTGAIDERERGRINATDLIISAISRKSGARVYVAVEASYVIDIRDVTRARNSAEILAKAFPNAEIYSAVYGRRINPEGQSEADRRGVFVYVNPRD